MPKKIRDLLKDLRQAGFVMDRQKGHVQRVRSSIAPRSFLAPFHTELSHNLRSLSAPFVRQNILEGTRWASNAAVGLTALESRIDRDLIKDLSQTYLSLSFF